jgi:hypothetical protein
MELADEIRKQGIVIPAPLAAVDATIMAYLVDQFGDKARWWRKPPQMDSLVIYAPLDDTGWGRLGYYGELWLRALSDRRTNLQAKPPVFPSDEETLYYLVGWAYFADHISHKRPEAESKLEGIVFAEVTNQHHPLDPVFKELLNTARIRKLGEGQVAFFHKKLNQQNHLLQHILDRLQCDGLLHAEPGASEPRTDSKAGNPGLSQEEVVQRLARALWAVEIHQQDALKTWKEIAREVAWPYHFKLLQDARHRLARAQKSNYPILEEAERLKEKLQRKSG